MSLYADLMHAPPRLSDLSGNERRRALLERHDAAREAWLSQRSPGRRGGALHKAATLVAAAAILSGIALLAIIAPPTVRWIAADAPGASVATPQATSHPQGPAVEAGRAPTGEGQ